MAKKNYYAVRKGKQPGIYPTWAQAQPQVSGFSGAQYAGFATKAEAEAFMQGQQPASAAKAAHKTTGYTVVDSDAAINAHIARLAPDEVIAFTDGSYNKATAQYAYGVVLITTAGELHLAKAIDAPAGADTHQVQGEVTAVEQAITWALAHGKTAIWIYADYLGVHEWGHGSWRANAPVAKQYQQFIKAHDAQLAIHFVKVHSHDQTHPIALNEEVDLLVKQTLGLR
ncbi:ribonuclease H1 domain-containing protein [Lacticaseibacillus jixiensis]|uniref:ribonuclease H1 domain-containing protein n=1 Tax=Lacticaseibacillus jixiensis TaxID=3231926 RepID=UPI0036F425E4